MDFDHHSALSTKSLLNETFSSRVFRNHYHSAKEQAVAFLMTVGAKALVLEEQKVSSVIDHDNINNEAELRKRIVTDERIRSIRRRILGRSTLCVFKRGRNEKVRSIDIIFHHDRQKGAYISWRSKLNYSKKFEVSASTIVSRIAVDEIRYHGTLSASALSMSPRANRRREFFQEEEEASVMRKRAVSFQSVSFLRLKNQLRSLDLSFRSPLEMEAFLLVLQKQAGLEIKSNVLIEPALLPGGGS